MSYIKHDTSLTNTALPSICNWMPPTTAVLVTVTCFRMCIMHMLCQMAENEGVAFAGEAGVFPSLLPDNAPSGAGELLPLTPCQLGNKQAQRVWQGKMGWDGNWGASGADIIPAKTRLTLRLRKCRARSWNFNISHGSTSQGQMWGSKQL